ncbi:MAG: C-terminal binding protein [Planctomycetaceae bacterium]
MSARLRVLVTDHPWPGLEIERALWEPQGIEVVDAPEDSTETLAALARDVDAIVVCWAPIRASVIAAATRCRLIARLGIGLDNIDIPAATRNGMLVTNVPDYCVEEVADHALALLLSWARNITWFDRQAKQGIYDLAAAPPMRRLETQTLGLLGLGRIGRVTAAKARGLGLRVLAHTRSGQVHRSDVEAVSWRELLSQSDYLCLHAPLTPETTRIINPESLRLMKPTAILINTSRGGLIDESALWEAISSGRLAGAALDVFQPEPPDLSQPLFQHERVIVTPHAAFVSVEAVTELRQRTALQVLDALSGRTPENVVNR